MSGDLTARLWALVKQWERDAAEARDASGYDDETTSADTEEAESAGAAEALAGAARDLRAALTGKPEDSEAVEVPGERWERCPGCGLDVELDWSRIIPPHDTPAPGLCDAAGVRMPEVTT